MSLRLSPVSFTTIYCVAYVAVLALDWPLFLYYPLTDEFNWGNDRLATAGPAMAWYGLMASAGGMALLAAALVPDRLLAVPLRNWLWLFPGCAMLGCVFLMRQFFV